MLWGEDVITVITVCAILHNRCGTQRGGCWTFSAVSQRRCCGDRLCRAESQESELLGSSPREQAREQKMRPPRGRKGRPSSASRQRAQQKQVSTACQCWPSYVIWPWSIPEDISSQRVAVLGVERLVAGAAVRPALPHDVALAAQRRLALEAAEVLHVPVSPLRLGLAAGLEPLGVVAPAEDLSLLVEVDEVHQQLAARRALETLRVPAAALAGAAREHRDVPAADLPAALGGGEERG
ncbi:hypothetical protein N1851_015130 [Merluccius polli]|uniref:Uncharacterized protein n=1 Tax=Merluccius polli TaxID=89951 RepID=A0AA47MTM3_MERPO|nr:hypothetical protein N1851_015130 [Merluccius polli]